MKPRRRRRSIDHRREAGIALMVVMVVFVVLFLVVFQLHYTTKLEERLSKARSTDAMGSAAIRSVAFYILEILGEDYRNSQNSTSGTSSTSSSESTMPASNPGGGGGPIGQTSGELTDQEKLNLRTSSRGSEPTAIQAGGSTGPACYDYIHENIFLGNQQSLNGITVKIRIVDGEGRFDLNQIWIYFPSQAETLSEKEKEEGEKGAAGSDKNLSDVTKADPTGQVAKALGTKSQKGSQTTQKKSQGQKAGASQQPSGQELSPAMEEELGLAEWEPPTEERRLETRKLLSWAIDMMYRYNVQYGFEYKVMPPDKQLLADAIEQYCFERRSMPAQGYIHLTTELLNVLEDLGESPEVYYGPIPEIPPGEEFYDRDQLFRYQKDEFGDLVGEYVYALAETEDEREMMQSQVAELQEMYGKFASFPGLGRMGSPMTRNMEEYSEVQDDLGNVFLMVPPKPIGLKDIFCTFSTGKININTAPVPVLYALLPLLIETEGEAMAEKVAMDIERYRNMYQPEYDDTDPTAAEKKASLAGAPSQKPRTDSNGNPIQGKKGSTAEAASLLQSSGAAGVAGLSEEELATLSSGGNTDYTTNYFTNLQQLKLIDGEDGGPEDYLTEQGSGVQRVDLEAQSPLQKVLHDYQQLMVFGSTYFTATLKAKTEDSSAVKTGSLTVLRDLKNLKMEVLQWKEAQR